MPFSLHTAPLSVPLRVVAMNGNAVHLQRIRELGLLVGTQCTIVRRLPFGGPMEIQLPSRTLGIRLGDVSVVVVPEPEWQELQSVEQGN